jgi:hypothetical protein
MHGRYGDGSTSIFGSVPVQSRLRLGERQAGAEMIYCYLKMPDRVSALTACVLDQSKTLEFGGDFTFPHSVQFLPDTKPKFPRSHDRYYAEGGTHWPDRWVLEV